jgi:ribosome maturation protein Sdo1
MKTEQQQQIKSQQQAQDEEVKELKKVWNFKIETAQMDAKIQQDMLSASLDSLQQQEKLRAERQEQERQLAVEGAVQVATRHMQQQLGGQKKAMISTLQEQLKSSNLQVTVLPLVLHCLLHAFDRLVNW